VAELTNDQRRAVIDYMARDYDSFLDAMRKLVPDKLPEWQGHSSESDFGNVLLQLFAHMGDILSYYQDRVANESFLGTAQTRRSIIEHLGLIGYRLATAAPAAARVQLSFPATAAGTVSVQRGFAFATKSQKERPSVRFEYLGPTLSIDVSALPIDPASGRKIAPTAIPVEEGRLYRGEILGVSDGSPNQRYRLAHERLILRSQGSAANRDVVLTTDIGGLVTEWALQESLAFSRAGQTDYTVEIDADDNADIVFGDGSFGAIPAVGSTIRVDYRVGGGGPGNVPARSIQTIIEAPALVLAGAQVSNLEPATGGAERESIERAVRQAPQVFRSLKRAVTAADYEALARQFNGVGKVRAERGNWNTVNLFVAPEGGGRVSDVLRANLLAYFDDKRPISTIIEIQDVDYVKVYVAAHVELESYYSRAEKAEEVRRAGANLLAFANVDFKDEIFLSKFYEAIEATRGVKFVNVYDFRREETPGPSVDPTGKLVFGPNEIPKIPDEPGDEPYAGGMKVDVAGGY
jgi:hypothetical protein